MKIAAFILDTGQPTKQAAFDSVYAQVDMVHLVSASPVNRAINQCFEMAEDRAYDYFCILGADTVHFNGSIKTMLNYMKSGIWSVMGRLVDYYRGLDDYGNHFYNTKDLNGYRVDETDPLYDHAIHEVMRKAGKKKALTAEVIGVHHPIWTSKEAFEKFAFAGMRYDDEKFQKYLKQVQRRWIENPHPVNAAAQSGMIYGRSLHDRGDRRTLSTGMFEDGWKQFLGMSDEGTLVWFPYEAQYIH